MDISESGFSIIMDTHQNEGSGSECAERMEDEEEPATLDYARHHALCIPYDSENLIAGHLSTLPNVELNQNLWTSSNASITNSVNALVKERLAVSKDAALLLKEVYMLQEAPSDEVSTADQWRWSLGLKQELPVLQTDNELDLLIFGSAAVPDLRNSKIPFEVVRDESDEGFAWPAKYLAYPAKCDEQVKTEKLAVSRDVLVYLQEVVRDTYILGDSEKIHEEHFKHRTGAVRRHITPPLLPLSPPLTPYIPSSPANHLPLAPDSSDSLAAETKELEQQIMDEDSIIRKRSDTDDSMLLDVTQPPQFSPSLDDQTPPKSKRKPENLKVEGPLTPPMFSDSPMKKLKSVSFKETLHQFIPESLWEEKLQNVDDSASDCYFEEIFEPDVRQAIKNAENERLSGVDTTARVDIPEFDFTPPVAPWIEYSREKGGRHRSGDTELDAQMRFLLKVKREHFKTANSWHGLSGLERNLPWMIFKTKIEKFSLDEKLHGETELNNILAEFTIEDIATSSAQVWKPDGLRILDEDDSEEEIEVADMEEVLDMEALVRKRKLEMEEEAPEVPCKRTVAEMGPQAYVQKYEEAPGAGHSNDKGAPITPAHENTPPTVFGQRFQSPQSRHEVPQGLENPNNDLMFGGFSVTMALHKFMKVQGKAVEVGNIKPCNGSGSHKNANLTAPQASSARESGQSSYHEAAILQQQQVTQVIANDKQVTISPSYALPAIPKDLMPCTFIITSTLLPQRSLIKQIEQAYEQAEFIYRDYSLPHSPAQEADILLSPSTGLIFASLQQAKQQSLPGHPERSPVKERIATLQFRYERLVVLISEGLSQELESNGSSRPDDPRDEEALARLKTFANRFEGEVLIKFVRGGGEALARSIVIEMASYGLPHDSQDIGDIKPVVEETTWELFLRRAGLNPFAAQVIVASLKQPFDIQPPITSVEKTQAISVFGLPGFLMMGEAERVRYFQAVMGGSRVLKRVNKLLDQQWIVGVYKWAGGLHERVRLKVGFQ
ncbi:hypothetical protein GQ44DRAFT_724202 [Phaeosphaeriaceae sp. PMI808]|nr:hypothetical protein GQ44DRAFT_724202 [Phaeosphaeriaceae sp. PMI808]